MTGEEVPDARDQVGVDPTGPATAGPTAGPPDLDHAIQAAAKALRGPPAFAARPATLARIAVEAAAPVLLQATRDRLADLEETARAVLSCLHAGNIFTAESLLRHALDGPAAQEEGGGG